MKEVRNEVKRVTTKEGKLLDMLRAIQLPPVFVVGVLLKHYQENSEEAFKKIMAAKELYF